MTLQKAMVWAAFCGLSLLSAGVIRAEIVAKSTDSKADQGVASPERLVIERAKLRHQAMTGADLKQQYQYFSPAYRKLNPFERSLGARPVLADYVDVDVLKVVCKTEALCTVTAKYRYKLKGNLAKGKAPKGVIERVGDERWLKVDQQWWFYEE